MIDFSLYNPFSAGKDSGGKFAVLDGAFPWEDLVFLDRLVEWRAKEGMVAYEIGAWTGMSTCCIATGLKDLNGHLTTIDTFKGASKDMIDQANDVDIRKILESNLRRFGVSDIVTIKEGNSNDFAKEIPDGSIDFMFIDGDHRFTQFKRDLDNWVPKIKPDGLICGHDFNGLGYDPNFIEVDADGDKYHHGIAKALKEKFGKIGLFIIKGKVKSTIWIYDFGRNNELSDKAVQNISSRERVPEMCSS